MTESAEGLLPDAASRAVAGSSAVPGAGGRGSPHDAATSGPDALFDGSAIPRGRVAFAPAGIDGLVAEERLRLFTFATAEKRGEYLWVLRAFDHARAAYVVLLHASDVADTLTRFPGAPRLSATEVGPLLEQLHQWGVLERSYDGTRAATLAEYRNRHFVYQFSQGGYHAYRAITEVLGARLDEAALSRLVLPELLADLQSLAQANRTGDAERVYRILKRLDTTLSELADRAAHFYLTLGDLVRTTEATPESFLAHKDALLAHMREFSMDLARFAPRLAAAIAEVQDTGVEEMIARAAACDERVLLSIADREDDWRGRWRGLRGWFVATAAEIGSGDGKSTAAEGASGTEAERLRDATMSAIAAVLSLLRRVTETRKGGVSRESALRHLAGWFTATPSADAAHALFDAVFGLGRPRHLAMEHPDADVIPAIRSWWDAPPLEIARTLAETGRPPSPGAPSRIARNDAGIRRLRQAQLDAQRARAAAAQSLAAADVHERVLDDGETEVLLRLLDAASTAWVPVSGRVGTTGSESGVTLTVREHPGSTVVRTSRGLLHLNGRRLEVRDNGRARTASTGSGTARGSSDGAGPSGRNSSIRKAAELDVHENNGTPTTSSRSMSVGAGTAGNSTGEGGSADSDQTSGAAPGSDPTGSADPSSDPTGSDSAGNSVDENGRARNTSGLDHIDRGGARHHSNPREVPSASGSRPEGTREHERGPS